jgi:SH3-like domain-containing protein
LTGLRKNDTPLISINAVGSGFLSSGRTLEGKGKVPVEKYVTVRAVISKAVILRAVISKVIAIGILLMVCPVVPAISAELSSIPSGAVACKGSVYTVDPDPKGTNVRVAPDKKAPVLQMIPYDYEGTEVDLAGCSDDWVLISRAQGTTSEFEFYGKGWVYASLLAVRAARPTGRPVPLYSKPDTGSSVIKMLAPDTEGRVVGCKGRWMHVRIGNQVGWLAPGDHCGNPVTTCS